jgi:D-alanine-D-alanine ligase
VKRLRVGVLYGGRSGEHEVSLASAAAVFANLNRERYEPIPLRIEKDGRWLLADRPPVAASAAEVIDQARSEPSRARGGREVFLLPRPADETLITVDHRGSGENARVAVTELHLDVIFPVLHGPYGEDGTIQGLLELANAPYVGAGVLASAVGMDKALARIVFAAHGLPVTPAEVVRCRDWGADPAAIAAGLVARLGLPLFVKPANLGSSVGISKVKEAAALPPAMDLAAAFDRKIVVEAAVAHAREIEVAVLGNDTPEASVPGEIIPSREFYDYEAKYLDQGSRLLIPADLSPGDAQRIRRLAIDAFRAIDGAGMARVDFLVSRSNGTIYLNELNTIPGFTTISMYAKLWEATGLAYPELLDRLIALALERHAEKQQLKTSL